MFFVAGDFKRAVVFGQALVEPEGRIAKAVPDEQVDIFMKGQSEGVADAATVNRERDVIHILIRLKESCDARWLSLIERLEGSVRFIVAKNHDGHRDGSIELSNGQKAQESFPKLFETRGDLAHVALAGIADEEKVFGLHSRPAFGFIQRADLSGKQQAEYQRRMKEVTLGGFEIH